MLSNNSSHILTATKVGDGWKCSTLRVHLDLSCAIAENPLMNQIHFATHCHEITLNDEDRLEFLSFISILVLLFYLFYDAGTTLSVCKIWSFVMRLNRWIIRTIHSYIVRQFWTYLHAKFMPKSNKIDEFSKPGSLEMFMWLVDIKQQ